MSIPINQTMAATANANMRAKSAAPKADDFSFWDLLDVVNPLQHLPVVSNIYRQVTGDHLGGFARIAGGALFGGVLGVASGVANTVYAAKHNGQDFGDVALAKLTGTAVASEITNEITSAKPLAIAVRPVPPAERFPDVIHMADIIWDTAKPTQTPEKTSGKTSGKTPNKALAQPPHVPDLMPEKLSLNDQTDITLAMANALAKYEKTKTIVPAKHN
jgi:hypothetical protein